MSHLDRILRSIHEVLKRGEIGTGPDQPLQPGDHVVGKVTDDRMKRLFTARQKLAIDMDKLNKFAHLHPEAKEDPYFNKRFAEIFRQFNIFNAIFSDALNEEFPELASKTWVSIRNDWTVVWNEEKKMAKGIERFKASQVKHPKGVRIPATIMEKHSRWSRIGDAKRPNPLTYIN